MAFPRRLTLAISWVLYLISFFLPAVGSIAGWRAAAATVSTFFYAWGQSGLLPSVGLALYALFLFSGNFLMLASLILVLRGTSGPIAKPARFGTAVAALGAMFPFILDLASLFGLVVGESQYRLGFGYYCWAASIVLMALILLKSPSCPQIDGSRDNAV